MSRWYVFSVSILLAVSFTAASGAAELSVLSGMVIDGSSGAVIEGASVYVTELNTGTLTAKDGVFAFKTLPYGRYTVRVSLVGYAPASLKITVPIKAPLTIELKPTPIVSDEVISTARGRQTRLGDIPGSAEVVTDADIHETNPVSIPVALSRKPGISVSSEMPWSSHPVIRGLTKDQIILLVDGCRVVTATATAAQFGTIANGDIERIELLKGPLSVLYGSGSTGGIVNVITRRGRFTPEPSYNLSVNPTFESAAGGLSVYERAGWSNSRFYLTLSQSNRRYTDYRAADELRIGNSQFQDRQTQASLGLKITQHHTLEGRFQYFSALDAGLPGGDSFPQKAVVSYPTTSRTLSDITWTWRPSGSRIEESRLNLYYQPVYRKVKIVPNASPSEQPLPSDDTKTIRLTPTVIYPEADHNVFGARWQNIIKQGSHTIVAGIEGWRKHMLSDRTKLITKEVIDKSTGVLIGDPETVTIKETPVPDSSQNPIGVFAEDAFAIGGRTRITLGARIDRIRTENDKAYKTDQPSTNVILWKAGSDTDISWSFVGGGVFTIVKGIDINLTAARSFRSPTLEERFLYAELGGKLTVGDPDIDPEKGILVEGGVSAEFGAIRLKLQGYLNSITDMVILMPGGEFNGQPADVYTNAGRARLRGMEASIDWVLRPRLLLQADISFTRGADEKSHTDLPAMPPMKAHIAARRGFGRGIWIEPLLTLVDRQDNVAPGESATPGYGIVDITIGKSLLTTGTVSHDLVFGVKNAGDKLYRDHLTVSRGYEMYGMGRSFFVSWKMNLPRTFSRT